MNARASVAIAFLFLSICPFVAGQTNVQKGAFDWEAPGQMMIPSKSGPLVAVVQTNRGPLMFSGNRRGPEIKCVFVPTNDLVWAGRVGCQHFCVFNDQVVGFQRLIGGHVAVYPIRERVPRGKTGVDHLKEDWQRSEDRMLKRFEASNRIDLNSILGSRFFIAKGEASIPPSPQITSIAVTDKECRLKLQGLNDAKAEVVLDLELNVISAALNGKKVLEKVSSNPR